MHALILQHQDDVPAGLLLDVLRADGVPWRIARLDRGEPLPDPVTVRLAVSLGSDAAAYDGSRPWIASELEWIREADRAGTPILGICFGAQMLASALGGTARRARRPECDWITISTREPQLIPAGPWLSWHDDMVELPPDAELIAQRDGCPQAFRIRGHLGVQFHPEATPSIVARWVQDSSNPNLDRKTILALTAQRSEQGAANAYTLFRGFIARSR